MAVWNESLVSRESQTSQRELRNIVQPEWNEFFPSGAGFSVLMPGVPTREDATADLSAPGIRLVRYSSGDGELTYSVAFPEPSDTLSDGLCAKDAIVALRAFIIAKLGQPSGSVSASDIDHDLVFVRKATTLRYRFVVVGHRWVELNASVPDGSENQAKLNKFFDSFRKK
jgi:hypothetical protein